MASAVKTTTTDIGDSRVRLDVEVEPQAIESQLQEAAAVLGNDMRVPGFRKGKVPAQVVIQQVGRGAVLDEAVRRGLPGWFEDAVADAGIDAVGDPKLNLDELPPRGSPLSFAIEIGVMPRAELGEYRGLEVGRREVQSADDEIDTEVNRVRESLASLETVDRAASDGDFVVVDFVGSVDGVPFEGGEARGHLLELGKGRLIPGFEEQLGGAVAGEDREVRVTFPEEYQAERLAGKDAVFATTVKEVKERHLPDLDDDFALEAGGFDTFEELRESIAGRIRETQESEIDVEFREAAVDAAAAQVKVDIPHELVHAKAHEMWHRTAQRFQQQGIDPQQYLQVSGKTEEELIAESEPDAERALRRESTLTAIVEVEGIEVTDEELLEALRDASAAQAGEGGKEPTDKQLQRSLKKAKAQGADEPLRDDIAMRRAVDLVVEHAKPVPVEQASEEAETGADLWTPEKDEPEATKRDLWTPGE